MVYLQSQQLSSVLFGVNTIINKGFANILDTLVIQSRHDMNLSVFAAETKACQGPVASLTVLWSCSPAPPTSQMDWGCPRSPSTSRNGRLPILMPSLHPQNWDLLFILKHFPNWPSPISPSTGCIPNPLLRCPPTIFHLSPLKSRKEVCSKNTTIFTPNMTSVIQPRPHLSLTYCLFLCLHLSMTLACLPYSCVPIFPTCMAPFLDFWWNSCFSLAWLCIHSLHNESKLTFCPRWHRSFLPLFSLHLSEVETWAQFHSKSWLSFLNINASSSPQWVCKNATSAHLPTASPLTVEGAEIPNSGTFCAPDQFIWIHLKYTSYLIIIVFLWAYPAPRRMGLQFFWTTDKNNSVQKLHGSCRRVSSPCRKAALGKGCLAGSGGFCISEPHHQMQASWKTNIPGL